MAAYEDEDEYCPHCDNHYVIEAKTPQLMLQVEGEDGRMDPSMIRDDRVLSRDDDAPVTERIDHGGYQAAAIAFQQKLASGHAMNQDSSLQNPAGQLPNVDQLDAELDWD
ncbi:hypothetical protein MYAM1_002664 [Malassezia yamatoensis]|uniref:Uncharacterized protein n=1 Tax=Malassezia yamatoensis TaxID=253288 RepID=A0AAJ5YSK0_9BASI|nr:hypothetical protein MYAM1_002664 [Malassezia yamatoensis]